MPPILHYDKEKRKKERLGRKRREREEATRQHWRSTRHQLADAKKGRKGGGVTETARLRTSSHATSEAKVGHAASTNALQTYIVVVSLPLSSSFQAA